MAEMMARHAGTGRIEWIGLRPERRADMVSVTEVIIDESGLVGDHGRAGKRAVTLVQAEHLRVIATLLRYENLAPEILRRNIVVSGINLLALRHQRVAIGDAILNVEGPCPPCSRMEEALGPGGYSAVRGHGGVYASVEASGRITVGKPTRLA